MALRELMGWPPTPRLLSAVVRSGLFDAAPVAIARAAGRLDVMGGIADYTGSLVCEMPLAVAAAAAAQRRDDRRVVIRSEQAGATVSLQLSDVAEVSSLREATRGEAAWARYAAGCLWLLAQEQATPGCTILIDSDVPLGAGVSSSAAMEVATMIALRHLLDRPASPMRIAADCQSVENRVVGAPCGVMDQVTACLGVQGRLIKLLCQPDEQGMPAQLLGDLAVPSGFAFIGVHSGVCHEVSGDPYTDTRVAAFMAQRILDGAQHLAAIDATTYRTQLRASLPPTLTGRQFLDRYLATRDPVTTVVPERTYHVRAAADHHVLEMDRVRRFVERLSAGTPADLEAAGQLMVESHHSYGDCARLGHPLTDRLVELAMQTPGVLGAKITGGGSGGTVAMLIVDDAPTRQAVALLRERYTAETGRPTLLFDGSGPGAIELGPATASWEDLP